MTTVFVTGATGAVGSAVVAALLADPDTELRLLIRAQSAAEADDRRDSLLHFLGVAPSDSARRERVRALRGDATAPALGLDAAAFADLCSSCTHIVHAAGAVRMNLPLDEARRSAVGSAREIVALARACPQLRKVEFVSTVGVGGRLPGTLPESWIGSPRSYHNTYEQAKAEAEDLVRAEAERGLPLTIHRPSMVVGDSRTGAAIHFQIFYHLCEFLSGRRTFGLCPRLGSARLDTVPSDHVGAAIAWSIREPSTAGAILHLCSGPAHAIALDALQRLVRAEFAAAGLRTPPLVRVPPRAFGWATKALAPVVDERTRKALGTLPVFLDYLATEQAFGNASTLALLAAAGMPLPDPSEYLPVVLRRYVARKGADAGSR